MKGELWAAWVSAGGSLLAVAVSVWLHHASLSDRKAADATAARNAALVVLPKFKMATKELTWTLDQLRSGRNPSFIGTDMSGRDFSVGYLRSCFDGFAPSIEAIGQLGSAAAAAQSAYQHFRELSEDLAAYIAPDHWPEDPVVYEGVPWVATRALIDKTEKKMLRAVGDISRLLQ